MDQCRVCEVPCDKRCAKCKSVSYCSAEHQKSDWRKHKNTCRFLTSQKNEKNGEKETEEIRKLSEDDDLILKMEKSFREPPYLMELLEDGEHQGDMYMFASRDLKRGEVIFQEYPAVLCPKLQPRGNMEKTEINFPCWGCAKSIRGGKAAAYRCSKCGLSVCDTICENAPTHKSNECKLIKQMKAKQKRRGMTDVALWKLYLDISVLRFLNCRDLQPGRWEYFQRLKSSSRVALYEKRRNCLTDIDIDISCDDLKLSLRYTNNDTELVSLAYKLLIAFSEPITITNGFENLQLRALYCYLSCVQHDCVGNSFSMYNSETQTLTMMAAVDIKKGDLLTYDFLGSTWGSTMTRMVGLLEKNIICTCSRCSDPTEFGTFCSSFRCTKCETGFYFQIEPDPTAPILDKSSKEVVSWKCNECSDTIPYETIHIYMETAQQDYIWAKECGSNSLGQAALKFYNNMPKNQKRLGSTHSLVLEVMDDHLQYDRISYESRDYLKLSTDITHTDYDIENFRRKRDFAGRLCTYLDKVKKDCIHSKKCYLYVEYGYYNLITVALDYKNKLVRDKSEVVAALDFALKIWKRAREMLKFLNGTHAPALPDYSKIVDNLSARFSPILCEDALLIPFLMTELRIEWSETDTREDGNLNTTTTTSTKEHKD